MRPNVYADDFDQPEPDPEAAARGFGRRWGRLVRGDLLSAGLWELPPGLQGCPYHLHRANEELLVVVAGRPTLRTPEGTRELEPGDVVLFPRGPEGTHALLNESDEPCRFLFASTTITPEVAEYPDSGKVMTYGPDYRSVFRQADAVDYLDGEDRRGGA